MHANEKTSGRPIRILLRQCKLRHLAQDRPREFGQRVKGRKPVCDHENDQERPERGVDGERSPCPAGKLCSDLADENAWEDDQQEKRCGDCRRLKVLVYEPSKLSMRQESAEKSANEGMVLTKLLATTRSLASIGCPAVIFANLKPIIRQCGRTERR